MHLRTKNQNLMMTLNLLSQESLICARCGIRKVKLLFFRTGRIPTCKACRALYLKNWKSANQDRYKKAREEYEKRNPGRVNRSRNQDKATMMWVWSLKENRPCSDCGGTFHPVAMDFDHRPGAPKTKSISNMVNHHRLRSEILREIAKCELVCSNCHRIRTAKEKWGYEIK